LTSKIFFFKINFQLLQTNKYYLDVDIRIDNELSSSSNDRNSSVKNPTTPPSSSSLSESSESTLGSSDEAYSPVPKRKNLKDKNLY